MDINGKGYALTIQRLCYWICFDLAQEVEPVTKRDFRTKICQSFNDCSDDDVFVTLEQMIDEGFVSFDSDTKTYELLKPGHDKLRNTYKELVFNKTTAAFFADRNYLGQSDTVKSIADAADPYQKYIEIGAEHIGMIITIISIILPNEYTIGFAALAKVVADRIRFLIRDRKEKRDEYAVK